MFNHGDMRTDQHDAIWAYSPVTGWDVLREKDGTIMTSQIIKKFDHDTPEEVRSFYATQPTSIFQARLNNCDEQLRVLTTILEDVYTSLAEITTRLMVLEDNMWTPDE